jgi:hypothetical protein
MKKTIFIIIMTLAFTAGLEAQNRLDQAKQETSAFLKSLSATVNADNFKMFGLTSPEEASQLEAGQVFTSNIIPLDQLKKYEGGDVKAIITNVNRASCTVINRQTQQTFGLVDLELEKDRYVVKGFANTDISSALSQVNKELFKQNFSIVRIPALNTYFGSFTDAADNKIKFVSLQNNPGMDTRIGEIRPAEDFLKRLVPMANDYNGLPW